MRLEIFITSFMSCSTSSTVTPEAATFWITASTSASLDRIAAGGRLVEQQHLRLGRERTGDLEPLQRAIRHFPGRPVRERAEADEREKLFGFGARVAVLPQHGRQGEEMRQKIAPLMQVAPDHHVLGCRHAEENLQVLKRARQPALREQMRREPGHLVTPKPYAPARGRVNAGNKVEQRGLAGAVRSDDGEDLARLDRERHARDRGHAAERDRDVLDSERTQVRLRCKRRASEGTMPAAGKS